MSAVAKLKPKGIDSVAILQIFEKLYKPICSHYAKGNAKLVQKCAIHTDFHTIDCFLPLLASYDCSLNGVAAIYTSLVQRSSLSVFFIADDVCYLVILLLKLLCSVLNFSNIDKYAYFLKQYEQPMGFPCYFVIIFFNYLSVVVSSCFYCLLPQVVFSMSQFSLHSRKQSLG